VFEDLVALARRVEALPCPTLFAAHGLCLTWAFELALACDLIIAAESASFGLVERVIGLTPAMGGTQRLAERAGSGRARELVMKAKGDDQQVEAYGPGTVRLWQPGQKDEVGPAASATGAAAPMPPGTPGPMVPANQPPETEMKLTIIQFAGKMIGNDRGKVYQQATFSDTIEVIHAPAERFDAAIDRHHLVPGAVLLTCADKFIVSVHKRPNVPPQQRMDAYGNAFIQSDEYEGSGEIVTADGPTVTLQGGDRGFARIMNRFNRTEQPGKVIVYNRLTGSFTVDRSPGGTIQGSPSQPPPKPPPPKQPR